MRILYISGYYRPAFMYGGPVIFSSALCEILTQLGLQVTVYTTDAFGNERLKIPSVNPVDVNGVPVWYFPLNFKNAFYFSTSFYRSIIQNGRHFDVVITETVWGYLQFPITKIHHDFGIPYVIQLHGQLLPWSLQQKKLKKQLFLNLYGRKFIQNAAALICTDLEEVAALQPFNFHTSQYTIPIGLDLDKFSISTTSGKWRTKYSISRNAIVYLFVGRLHPKKKPDLAVSVLLQAAKENIDAHLIVVGPDESGFQDQLMDMARTAGCVDRLHFTGLLSDHEIVGVYNDSDLLLMPSEPQSENFGVSACEALACGVAVLTSDGVPVGRWAEQAGAGMRVSTAGDEFIRAAISLALEPNKLAAMGRNGRDLAQRQFDIRNTGTLWLDLLREITETRKYGI
jgi:glycosyltransferase involved in cell wall biosynthesis